MLVLMLDLELKESILKSWKDNGNTKYLVKELNTQVINFGLLDTLLTELEKNTTIKSSSILNQWKVTGMVQVCMLTSPMVSWENVVTNKLSLLFVKLSVLKKKLKNTWVFMVLIMMRDWLDYMKLNPLINSVMEKVTEEHLLESLLQLSTVVGKVDLKIEELLLMLTLMLYLLS